jgi:hypothetical protein
VGVFHSGVEIYGKEYAYGGHPFPSSGIYKLNPRDAGKLGEQFQFRQSVHVGHTDLTEDDVKRILAEFEKDFRCDRYHLINKKCNHFSGSFTKLKSFHATFKGFLSLYPFHFFHHYLK